LPGHASDGRRLHYAHAANNIQMEARMANLFTARRRQYAPILAGLLMLSLAACTAMPLREGPTAALLPGIEKPRTRDNIDITIHEVPILAWGKCLGIVAKASPMMAVISVLTLSPMLGCARVARDADLAPGQKPWCVIAVPEGDAETLEHELRHCEGWDHPRSPHGPDHTELTARER
jgi:hypothetical protein